MAPSFVSTMTVVSQPPKSTEAIKRAIGVKTFRFFRMFVVSLPSMLLVTEYRNFVFACNHLSWGNLAVCEKAGWIDPLFTVWFWSKKNKEAP